ncbi:MAG: DegT/DnrJ/EryC1/StrS family aminotransferase [Pseudotabrizicola sp.]|uniref:DegT/DnrJ/EryC1/StrS family aminotransferase n=1 Tax=Pseudotabrizicola sp. TaxID=2939647 RepID=UPI0027310D02|nr:DegT/DnrJ/EryC1/StrS family aminotransferase [Pseudotabrizicola sp.]MDP2081428.1 DegT/DnrJ/EryC1/StrS family aminotransferase [Pseudotabrizicola sp.]MDZ7572941.1 DegT/DnrJ/EryC1/StrS family aminotransferase [Pseudotabrizicola sp.]
MTTGRGSTMESAQAQSIHVSRPMLPTSDQLSPFLRNIDTTRFYSNGGNLHEMLQKALAGHFAIDPGRIGIAGSGTAALIGLLVAAAGRAKADRPLCVCPAYTFVATASAAQACGYAPYLVDVDAQSWALDPVAVEALPDFAQVGAVILVAPYGRQIDLAGWRAFAQRTGVPVVIDAAASFDTFSAAEVIASGLPVAISLHATKTLSTAEGGLMICGDQALIQRAVAAVNFGFVGERISVIPGINGKLSEYHAAVGLADLETWPQKRAAFMMTASIYTMLADFYLIGDRIEVNSDAAVPYALFIAQDAAEAERVGEALAAQNIESRRWYGHGLQSHPAYAGCRRANLDTSTDVAARVLGLPFSVDISARNVDRIIEEIARTLGGVSRQSRRNLHHLPAQ